MNEVTLEARTTGANEIILHGIPGSPYTRSARLGLEEKGAAYRLAVLPLGTSKSAEHLQRHPFGRIPVMDHGTFRLYETQAILRYIDKVLPGPALQPADPVKAARMDQIVGIVDWYFFTQVTVPIVAERFYAQIFWNRPTDEATVAAAVPDARVCMRELARLKGETPFLAGAEISIADLMLAPHLSYFAATPEGAAMLAESPLRDWLALMAPRPSMRATEAKRLAEAA